MKKLLSLVAVLTAFSILLAGCAGRFDMDKAAEKLKEQGLKENVSCENAADLDRITSAINSDIEYMGGDFAVEITAYENWIMGDDLTQSCALMTFASKEQATDYAALALDYYRDGDYRVAQSGRVVVVTNLDAVADVIDLEFK